MFRSKLSCALVATLICGSVVVAEDGKVRSALQSSPAKSEFVTRQSSGVESDSRRADQGPAASKLQQELPLARGRSAAVENPQPKTKALIEINPKDRVNHLKAANSQSRQAQTGVPQAKHLMLPGAGKDRPATQPIEKQ